MSKQDATQAEGMKVGMKKIIGFLIFAGAAYVAWDWWKAVEADEPPGAFIDTEPRQKVVLRFPFWIKDSTIFTLADYRIDGRILSVKSYADDEEAHLSPVDLAIGWGPMADEENLSKISFSQSGRFLHWTPNSDCVLSGDMINEHSSNSHIIPATPEIEKFVRSLKATDRVSLKGRLVSVSGNDGWHWTSSLTRKDQGDGACELFYVESGEKIITEKPGKSFAPVTAQTKPANQPTTIWRPELKTIVLQRAATVDLPHGQLTIPAGEKLTILSETSTSWRTTYRGFDFWVKKKTVSVK